VKGNDDTQAVADGLSRLHVANLALSKTPDELDEEAALQAELGEGGMDENTKFTNWYEKTKELYKLIFEIYAPEDIWEPSHIRFSENNFQRINLNQNWMLLFRYELLKR
jgi:hypothetical protein